MDISRCTVNKTLKKSTDQAAISDMKHGYKVFTHFFGCQISRIEETNEKTNKVIGIALWDLSKGKAVFHFSGQKQVGPDTIPVG